MQMRFPGKRDSYCCKNRRMYQVVRYEISISMFQFLRVDCILIYQLPARGSNYTTEYKIQCRFIFL